MYKRQDIERALAGVERGAEFGQRELRLARPGGTGHAQAEGFEFEPPCPVREAAGNPVSYTHLLAAGGASLIRLAATA